MKRTYAFLSTLLLAFLLSAPVFAQEATQAADATPTVEAVTTEVAPPVSEPVVPSSNTVLDWLQFVVDNGLHWYLFAFITVLFVGNLVPQSELQSRREAAKKTETPIDDTLVMLLELMQSIKGNLPAQQPTITVTAPSSPPYTTGGGQETTITVSQPPVGNTGTGTMDVSLPPVTVYPAIQTTAFMDTFGKRGDNSYTWRESGHAPAVIEIPDGYDFRLHNKDAAGAVYPYKAINTNTEYGTRLNVASVAGVYQFIRKQTVQLGTGAHEIMLSYVASVKDSEGGQPMHNWLWTEAFIDGQPVIAGIGDVNHRALENGAHVATWLFENSTPRTVTLSFHVTVHWASAEGNSTIDLKAFGLKGAILVG